MLPQTEDTVQSGGQTSDTGTGKRLPKHWLALAIALVTVTALLASGIGSRVRARNTLNAETARTALAAVSVVSPKQTAPADEIILPGNVQPFITSPIYSRTDGYPKKVVFRYWIARQKRAATCPD